MLRCPRYMSPESVCLRIIGIKRPVRTGDLELLLAADRSRWVFHAEIMLPQSNDLEAQPRLGLAAELATSGLHPV